MCPGKVSIAFCLAALTFSAVAITESDIDRAIRDVQDDDRLHDLLTATVDPESVEIPG